jgi:uncharacterized membrane protein HdeD (DUF308 family)
MVSSAHAIVKESVGWAIALSILMIVVGLLAIAIPHAAGMAAAIVIGWALIMGGIADVVFAWHMRSTNNFVWELLLGLLYLLVGVYMLMRPVASLVSLTLFLAIYLFFRAILELVLAFRLRGMAGSGWLVFQGIAAAILGFMILRSWPWSSLWAIGTLIGVSIVFAGVAHLSLALGARRVAAGLV